MTHLSADVFIGNVQPISLAKYLSAELSVLEEVHHRLFTACKLNNVDFVCLLDVEFKKRMLETI